MPGYKRLLFALCTTLVIILCLSDQGTNVDNVQAEDYISTLTLDDFENMDLPFSNTVLVRKFLTYAKEQVAKHEELGKMLDE